MTRTLQIQLLGGFRLVYGDTSLTTIQSVRLQALLAYLLLHPDAPQPRQQIAFALWPDSTEAHAHGSLRKLLHQLNCALPDTEMFLRVDKLALQWRLDAPIALDVAEFKEAASASSQADQLRRAANLYRGDLLPSCYDDWIIPERERLRQLFSAVLERLVVMLENQREYGAAIQYAQRLLLHDPLHEETYRHLMRLHALDGDRARALRAYHACATALERELGVAPSAATREQYEGLLRVDDLSEHTPAVTLLATSPLVGRSQEWARLQAAWRSSVAGRAGLVLLSGTAGIGKTRLADEMIEWTSRQGIATAHARSYAAEGALAYAPVADWLRARRLPPLAPHWKDEIARLLPELVTPEVSLGPMREAWQRQHLFEALAHAFLQGPQPLLLVIDDLQWCDRDTLEWLHYLLRFDPRARLLILGTARAEEISTTHPLSALLAALRRVEQVAEIELEPLNRADATMLAANVMGRPLSPALATRVFQETEGNALFVVEMARAERAQSFDVHASTQARGGATPLPPTVQAVVRARLAGLSPSSRKVASVAAVIGREFTFDVLQQASGEHEDRLVQALDELWQRRIVREQGADAYDFSHDKLREVAYAELSETRRRILHRRVAQALEALYAGRLDAVSGQIAAHLDRAGSPEAALPHYQRAAKVAQQVYANPDAIDLYRRALTLIERLPPARVRAEMSVELFQALGDVLERTANHDEARVAYESALKYVPAHAAFVTARLQRRSANTYKAQGRYEEALQVYARSEAALDRGEPGADPVWWEEWIDLQFDRSALQYGRADLDAMTGLAEKIKPVVERHGTIFQQAQLYRLFNQIAFRRERFAISDEALANERAAFAAIERSGDANHLNANRFQLGFVLLWRGLLDEAEEQLRKALAWDEQIGETYEKTLVLTYLAILHRKRGRVEPARQFAHAALESATSAHMAPYVATAKANLSWVAWKQGKSAEAEAEAQAALAMWEPAYPFQWTALLPLIAIETKRGQTAQAVRYARALFERHQQRLPEAVEAAFRQAIRLYERDESARARSELAHAVELGTGLGYI